MIEDSVHSQVNLKGELPPGNIEKRSPARSVAALDRAQNTQVRSKQAAPGRAEAQPTDGNPLAQ